MKLNSIPTADDLNVEMGNFLWKIQHDMQIRNRIVFVYLTEVSNCQGLIRRMECRFVKENSAVKERAGEFVVKAFFLINNSNLNDIDMNSVRTEL